MRRGRKQRHPGYLISLWLAAILAANCSRLPSSSEDSLYQDATLSLRHGDLKQAQAETDRGMSAWRNRPESLWYWKYRILNAETLLGQGRPPKDALALIEPPFPTSQEISPLEARWKTVRATILLRLSRPEETARLLDEAQALASSTGESSLIPRIEGVRGQLLLSLHRDDEAEQEFRSSLQHAEEQNDFYYQAAALNNLGVARLKSSHYDAAIPLLERALAAARQAGALLIESAAATNIGLCANNLGEFDKALASYQEAIEIQQKGAMPYLQATLGELGNSYMRQDEPQKAIPYYRQALDLARRVNATADESKWSGNLALAFIEVKDLDQAEKLNNESIALKQQAGDTASLSHSRLTAASIASEREQYDQAASLYAEALRLSAGDPEVLWEAHAGLGNVFRKTGDDKKASEHFEAAIRVIEDARTELKTSSFKITLLSRLIRFYQDYVDALVDRQAYDKALQVVESSRARVLSERLGHEKLPIETTSAPDYQRVAARSGSVLLSYWLSPKRSFLWVITAREKKFFILPPQHEIESQVESHQAFIQNLRDPLDAGPIAGDRLYETLLAPARDWIPSGSRVVLVPDGSLHSLNFETLPVPGESRHYWIEDATVSIAPSLDSQLENLSPRRPKSLLLIGDPESAAKEFQRLPYAGREIHSIEQRLASLENTVYEGSRARPAVYRESRPENFSIIHFAAHASANPESPLDSAIILSPSSDSFKLYARDLINLPLNADLVTISGCKSAGARVYSGEGLVGFAWTFLQAGARNVIAGLWDVSDASTAQLMDQLYGEIGAGKLPPDALRTAKLGLIHSSGNFRKPYYWGPFQVYVRGTSGK